MRTCSSDNIFGILPRKSVIGVESKGCGGKVGLTKPCDHPGGASTLHKMYEIRNDVKTLQKLLINKLTWWWRGR